MGRANWCLIDTIHGAQARVIFYSLVETTKVKIYECLKRLQTDIPKHVDDTSLDFLDDLLTWSETLPEERCKKI